MKLYLALLYVIFNSFAKLSHFEVLFINCFALLATQLSDSIVSASTPELSAHFYLLHIIHLAYIRYSCFLESSGDVTSTQIGLMYSASYVPAFVFAILGGLFAQKIGSRAMVCYIITSSLLFFIHLLDFDCPRAL